VREDLTAAIRWDLFAPADDAPEKWTYRTVAQTGEAWGLRFEFAEPPAAVETLRRDGSVVSGEGEGLVTITTEGGCELTVALPFSRELPTVPCTSGRLELSVAPRRVRAGRVVRLRFRAVTLIEGRRVPVAGARIRVARRSLRTNARGRASTALRVPRARRRLYVRASKPGLRGDRASVRLAPALRRSGAGPGG
jgi:hypothetical protein